MGQFSWIYSDTGEPVYDGERADTYLLVPKEFQKKQEDSEDTIFTN